MTNLLTELQDYAETLVEQYQIPAVSLAIWHKSQLYQAAAGTLNIETHVKATTDSIFQIGSITKVFTTCLVMQLVDEDRINLDMPVLTYLRDFQVADIQATRSITVRQLLNHTNGISGDYTDATQTEDNAIARYVDRINLIPQVHEPGAQYSYSNTAFVVAGRLVEVTLGVPWQKAIEERIFKPLGMTHAITDPRETLRHRAAMGHFSDADNPQNWCLSSTCYSKLGTALAPAGSVATMSAADLITFSRAHLNKGKTATGESWLSSNSIQLMQTPTVALPPTSEMVDQHCGLGWKITVNKHSGATMLSHNGLAAGQNAMLNLFPDQNIAFAVVFNGAKPGAFRAIHNHLIHALLSMNVEEPEPLLKKKSTIELSAYTGTYASLENIYQIKFKEGSLKTNNYTLVMSHSDKLNNVIDQLSLLPLGGHLFAAYNNQGVRLLNVIFITNTGEAAPSQLFIGGRLNNRVHPIAPKQYN